MSNPIFSDEPIQILIMDGTGGDEIPELAMTEVHYWKCTGMDGCHFVRSVGPTPQAARAAWPEQRAVDRRQRLDNVILSCRD